MGDIAAIDAGQQHLRALEHANRVRLARAEMKRDIASGRLGVADVLRSKRPSAPRSESPFRTLSSV